MCASMKMAFHAHFKARYVEVKEEKTKMIAVYLYLKAVFRIRIHRNRKFLGHPDPLVVFFRFRVVWIRDQLRYIQTVLPIQWRKYIIF